MDNSRFLRSATLAIALIVSTEVICGEPLREAVPAETYEAAGLAKLSESEQAALLEWLRANGLKLPVAATAGAATPGAATPGATTPGAATPEPPSRRGFGLLSARSTEPAAGASDNQTRIVPPFSGWSGRTVFTLENGEVWQQRMDGEYQHQGDDLRVELSKNVIGMYTLKMVSSGRWIGVRRIR